MLGRTLILGRLDGFLVALNANTGEKMWETEIARQSDGYSMTGAPLVVGRTVVVGGCGWRVRHPRVPGRVRPGVGTPAVEIRDDSRAGGKGSRDVGKRRVAHRGRRDVGHGKLRSGARPLVWGVGNPAPDFIGEVRPGDNLYTDSVIALHASTGTLAWHFQFTPHDEQWHESDADSRGRPDGNTTRKVISLGESQRLLLRARPGHRPIPRRHVVRESELGPRPRPGRPPHPEW